MSEQPAHERHDEAEAPGASDGRPEGQPLEMDGSGPMEVTDDEA